MRARARESCRHRQTDSGSAERVSERVEMSGSRDRTMKRSLLALPQMLLCATHLLVDDRRCGGDAHRLQGGVAPADETERAVCIARLLLLLLHCVQHMTRQEESHGWWHV